VNLEEEPSGWCGGLCVPSLEPKTKRQGSKHEEPHHEEDEAHKLGQLTATAIAGNDITSSCLYVAGICTASAGKLAPIALALVVVLLYLFRSIYAEVGTALPLNGGAYNVLLNTTTKIVASLAACLTLLSYVATAVVSGSDAVQYAFQAWNTITSPSTPIDDPPYLFESLGTVGVLGAFALLTLIGISESAGVALVIFVLHLTTLVVLTVSCIVHVCIHGFDILVQNWQDFGPVNGNYAADLFYGFSAALLGVSGFETSSNYIEEQRAGVFPKTLRNMWICVAIFNPLLSLLSMCMFTVQQISTDYQSTLLSAMGNEAAGHWLEIWVSVDAAIVLCGAVLTSYVGIIGLAKRMALDRCLPQFFIAENRLRGTTHWIIIAFFVVTSSLYFAVNGNIDTLSGVYSIAFLSVMSLFAFGNMLLKYKRDSLPRPIHALWLTVIAGLAGVITGLIGNIMYQLSYLAYFALYFGITLLIVFTMFARAFLLRLAYRFVMKTFLADYLSDWFVEQIHSIMQQEIVFFAKRDDIHVLNKAILYVRDNELAANIKIVHCFEDEALIPPRLQPNVMILDEAYPKLKLDLVCRGSYKR
jgi:amino acid transporter